MNLKIQIITLAFSFIFGILFGIIVNINYSLLFNKNRKIKCFGNFILIIDVSLFYFLVIKRINNGILHLYFLLILVLGFYFGFSYTKFLRKK